MRAPLNFRRHVKALPRVFVFGKLVILRKFGAKKDAHQSGKKTLGMVVVKAGSKGKETFCRPLRHLTIVCLALLSMQSSAGPPFFVHGPCPGARG